MAAVHLQPWHPCSPSAPGDPHGSSCGRLAPGDDLSPCMGPSLNPLGAWFPRGSCKGCLSLHGGDMQGPESTGLSPHVP